MMMQREVLCTKKCCQERHARLMCLKVHSDIAHSALCVQNTYVSLMPHGTIQ